MDNDYIDPRTFMVNCQSISDPRESMVDPRRPIRSSFKNSLIIEPLTARNIAYHTQISRSTSVNQESSRQSVGLDNLEHELTPLQRKPIDKFIQKNHKKHSCTDVHCLLIFICFIVVWVYIASYAFSKGDLDKLLIPTDSNNAKCGLDSGVRNKENLFFFNLDKCLDAMTPIAGCDTKQICVEKCPQKTFMWPEIKNKKPTDLNSIKEDLICDSNVDKKNFKSVGDIENAINKDYCSGWYLKSTPVLKHCVWDFSDQVCNILPKLISGRSRRSSDLPPENLIINFSNITNKFNKFLNVTQSFCSEKSATKTALNKNVENSESNLKRIITAIVSKFSTNDNEIFAENISHDLRNSWYIVIVAFVLHIFVVLLFITLLRWLAAPLVWISICGVILGLSASLVFSYLQYNHWSTTKHVEHHEHNLMAKIKNLLENKDFWLYTTIILGAILTILVLIITVIRKRIKIAVAIIKEASKAIINIKSSIFFPIFPGILYIFVTTLSVIIMLHLNSIGNNSFMMIKSSTPEKCICNSGPDFKPYELGDSCNPELFEKYCRLDNGTKLCVETSCSFKEIVKEPSTQWYMLFNIFGFLWVTFFISAYEEMVLACTFSSWYWTFDKKNIPKLPLLKAVWITTAYHLGTLAFGSLILAICRMIRYILELIEKKVKAKDNAITRAILCCMKCFFWLLENFLRFLNNNAYITCAIHSTSFCQSSRKAFTLITQNIIRVYALDKVSHFLFTLSKVLLTGCTSYTTYFVLTKYYKADINYAEVPATMVAIVSYVMAHFIFNTYSMAVDTLFFCFLEDSTENDGSAEKPFYMSKELNKLLGKSKKKRKQLQK